MSPCGGFDQKPKNTSVANRLASFTTFFYEPRSQFYQREFGASEGFCPQVIRAFFKTRMQKVDDLANTLSVFI